MKSRASRPCKQRLRPHVERVHRPRRSARAAFLAALGGAATLVACGAATPPPVDAPSLNPGEATGAASAVPLRRPDAVLIDPPSATPVPVVRADGGPVVALKEPIGSEAAARVVRAWLDAWVHGSVEALAELLSPDATSADGRTHGRAALLDTVRQRLQSHEYGRLAGLELVRAERIERWDYEDLGAKDAPPRPADMRPDDLLVRVPIEVTHVAGERLFGDWLTLVLRRDGTSLRVAAYGESDEK